MRALALLALVLLAGCAAPDRPPAAPAPTQGVLCIDESYRPVDCLSLLDLPWEGYGADEGRLCIDDRYRPTPCPPS